MSHQYSHKPFHTNHQNRGQFPTPNRAGDRINYHVLKCRPVINQSSPQVQHDHLQILLEIDSGTRYWATVNIRSGQDQVYYLIHENYSHAILDRLLNLNLPQGFTKLESTTGGIAIDYIRENMVNLGQMDKLPPASTSDSDNIEHELTTILVNVMRSPDSRLYIFGSRFDNGEQFSSYDLPVGIHDIHMNQGSKPPHDSSNGVYQDGVLFAHFPSENRWSAVFLKFASQAENTDSSGQPV